MMDTTTQPGDDTQQQMPFTATRAAIEARAPEYIQALLDMWTRVDRDDDTQGTHNACRN